MPTVRIDAEDDAVVLYFGTKGRRINAYTLASTLVSFADAAKRANTAVNPGYEIEVVVEVLGEGSFKAKLRAIYSRADNLWSGQDVRNIVLNLIAGLILLQVASDKTEIIINSDEVLVKDGDNTLVIPREVYDAAKEAEKDEKVRQPLSEAFERIESDSDIESFGISDGMEPEAPKAVIPRSEFEHIIEEIEPKATTRKITEEVELQIVKAILKRSKRKWEFVWRGNEISAPIVDDTFYTRFFSHAITIAPGDTLECTLEITQTLQPEIDIYTNRSYRVIAVKRHVARPKQAILPNPEEG